jgi:hypothetical protein
MSERTRSTPFTEVRCTRCSGARLARPDGSPGACSFIGCPDPLFDVAADARMREVEALGRALKRLEYAEAENARLTRVLADRDAALSRAKGTDALLRTNQEFRRNLSERLELTERERDEARADVQRVTDLVRMAEAARQDAVALLSDATSHWMRAEADLAAAFARAERAEADAERLRAETWRLGTELAERSAGIVLRGWWCQASPVRHLSESVGEFLSTPCDTFNGEEHSARETCRRCGAAKPQQPERRA